MCERYAYSLTTGTGAYVGVVTSIAPFKVDWGAFDNVGPRQVNPNIVKRVVCPLWVKK